jgi:hypothetical protein
MPPPMLSPVPEHVGYVEADRSMPLDGEYEPSPEQG